MRGILKGLKVTLSTFFRRPVTVQYPDKRLPLDQRFRGFPGLLWDFQAEEPFCTGCYACARACPTGAIQVEMIDNENFKEGKSPRRKIVDYFTLDMGLCIQCNICVEVCNFDAIEMTQEFELGDFSREGLIYGTNTLLEWGSGRRPAGYPWKSGLKEPVSS